MILRVVLSLAVVFGLLWYFQRRVSRGAQGQEHPVTVVAKQGLGVKASVVTIDTGGRRIVLGVTEQSITVIHEGAAPDPVTVPESASAPADTSTSWEAVSGSILDPKAWKQAGTALRGGLRK